MKFFKTIIILYVFVLLPVHASLYAFSIDIKYDYDNNSFFNTQEKKDALAMAVNTFSSRITSTPGAITPSGDDHWTVECWDPRNMQTTKVSFTDPSIAANTLVLYVGGYAMQGYLGFGGPGWCSSYSGSDTWKNTVDYRGGSSSSFSTWGGSISFDSGTAWYFGASATVPADQFDFYSTAIHEIGHVLGIGTATDQWTNKITDNKYTGTYSVEMYGQSVPVDPDKAHWAAGTKSKIPGTETEQECSMVPSGNMGQRIYFTDLDWAGVKDMGWGVAAVPEPATILLFFIGLPLSLFLRKK